MPVKKDSKSITIALPAFPKSISIAQILVVLLLICSFVIGVLFTKVRYLQSDMVNTALTQPVGNPGDAQQPVAQVAKGKIKPVSDEDHIRGNKDAKVVLVEYSDLECPYCKQFHPTMQEILKTYGDKVSWVYRHYPLEFHQNAQKEAEASECVNELGGNDKFWIYVDKMFEKTTSNGTGFALDKLGPLAADVGVDQQQFQVCLDSNKYEKHVKDEMADGASAGVDGTPATFIVPVKGGVKMVSGAQPISAFKIVIDEALSQ